MTSTRDDRKEESVRSDKKRSTIDSFFDRRGVSSKRGRTESSGQDYFYRQARVPRPFRLEDDTLLVARFNPTTSNGQTTILHDTKSMKKLAAFDFDDTLAIHRFEAPENCDNVYSHAVHILRALAHQNYVIAILTNESLDRLKNQAAIEKKLRQKCSRLSTWIQRNRIDFPISIYVALSKEDKKHTFHKSKGDGMWRRACRDLLGSDDKSKYDHHRSFFVGDSRDDANMAQIASVQFHHVTTFFTKLYPPSAISQLSSTSVAAGRGKKAEIEKMKISHITKEPSKTSLPFEDAAAISSNFATLDKKEKSNVIVID
mmetsp:Transcript_17895/g.26870  ORF Transcript_17895/g.26870 Transcript_17895/m.26870 type:complete len:315 (+) Transcript_17895:23-967(+)|eukprot:CAMPEP_0197316408 /NCGR_PEP_ID=MMETSP0891-20130614/42681_1 /TAXON_ID=44058 ORGANISM="Aureoumbra lagunensis, Strain CCMP1510" /NCGR_SAMPLE_ID=MMETSP0891 /ASSEMBLY_ACC=CAM_ASM_000534 /LENGTH=314 /DNA_ID=CAMNT_0042805867 /DNA_START=13 /DNA_END=957 /DNA_ORIENTATION=-